MVTVGVCSFLGSLLLFQALGRRSPTTPDLPARQTYQMTNHGYLFYVTREQCWLFYGLLYGGWGLGASAALLNWRWKVIHNLTPQGWQLPK
ncbi:MAG: hypothetical protein QOF24_2712 [Verrucomicrobiota bacterium]|jgi:hypothetical protein